MQRLYSFIYTYIKVKTFQDSTNIELFFEDCSENFDIFALELHGQTADNV